MGKISECFSYSCFSFASPQQPPNTGPSHSTSPSSSQLPQQPPISGPSTSTTRAFDLESFLHQFKDPSELHDLIKFIEDLLKNASGEKCEEGCSSQVSSYIQDGQTVLEFADKHIGKLPGEVAVNLHILQRNYYNNVDYYSSLTCPVLDFSVKMKSIDGLSAETPRILVNLLKGAGKIHWVGAALSVVGFVLDKINQISRNKEECLEILRGMVNLGKQIIELNEEIPEQKEKLIEAVECIVVGCSICTSQLSTSKIFRFLASSVNADTLNGFNVKIDRLYHDLQLSVTIDTHKIVPKIAPQSQELYALPGAVGIGSAQDEVIKLLDLTAQHTLARVVVVHGFGGIGKTTLADAVYALINLQNYKHSRIHLEQNCTKNDIKVLQQQILYQLFSKNVVLNDCDQGRGTIRSLSRRNDKQPLFMYIDNGLKSTDLQELLPEDLGDWLPLKSRILLTTRNLQETDLFVSRNVQRHAYAAIPLPDREAREILLKKVSVYTDETYIHRLLQLCGGVPLLLELAGSQLALNTNSRTNIVLEMLSQGQKVEEKDISDRMVDFVYRRLLPPVQEAFLDIITLYYPCTAHYEMPRVGEEELRTLEEASFVKRNSTGGQMSIHDIVKARGKRMSEQEGNIIRDRKSLSKCLVNEKKLQKVKVIYINKTSEHPPIEINESHLNRMSDSLRILVYEGASGIKWEGKCRKPFKKLRYLYLPSGISDLPMEFEKLEHLSFYCGPMTQEMSLYELPPTLRYMMITNIISCENGVAYSRIPPNLTPPSSLVQLYFHNIEDMESLPNGVKKLTMLKELKIYDCREMKELPSKVGDLSNLEKISLIYCYHIKEWPSSLGDLSKLKTLDLQGCSSDFQNSLPSHIAENCTIIN